MKNMSASIDLNILSNITWKKSVDELKNCVPSMYAYTIDFVSNWVKIIKKDTEVPLFGGERKCSLMVDKTNNLPKSTLSLHNIL